MKIWLGKITGATFGLFSGGPFGIIIGMIVGHLFDQFISKDVMAQRTVRYNCKFSRFSSAQRFV